jgi:predicted DNA-binding transcriptional regulator AlpA
MADSRSHKIGEAAARQEEPIVLHGIPRLISREEVATASGLCKTTIDKLIKRGELRSVRILRRRMVFVDSYVDLLRRLEDGT